MNLRTLTIALATCATAQPALALSCLRPDIVRTFESARDSEENFWIVKGHILSDGSITLPKKGADGNYPSDAQASTPARFSGVGLSTDGQWKSFDQNITLKVSCLVVWCGSPPLDQEVFAAIEVTDKGPVLSIGACPFNAIPVTEGAETRLLACMRNGDCSYD